MTLKTILIKRLEQLYQDDPGNREGNRGDEGGDKGDRGVGEGGEV